VNAKINSSKLVFGAVILSLLLAVVVPAQKKTKKKVTPEPAPQSELAKLREEYISATKDFKASLQKLLTIYEGNVKQAEEKLEVSKKLLADGLISRLQVEENERAVAAAKEKVRETQKQMTDADSQVAGILMEAEAEQQLAKNIKLAKGRLVQTTSFIRYLGVDGWSLGEAWKIQRFFSDSFKKQLPIAVFGQGAIHERWRLDHRNAMDISLHPDTVEGQALQEFLRKNGIPYLAFRGAIPGTATGPHIHIGRPSHRY
jgi:hypothetical protein